MVDCANWAALNVRGVEDHVVPGIWTGDDALLFDWLCPTAPESLYTHHHKILYLTCDYNSSIFGCCAEWGCSDPV